MPVIARFYGLIIKMYFQQVEHNPPHFHVIYGEYSGVFAIETCEMIEGDLPQKAQSMIKEWGTKYKTELLEIWNTQKFIQLPPLE